MAFINYTVVIRLTVQRHSSTSVKLAIDDSVNGFVNITLMTMFVEPPTYSSVALLILARSQMIGRRELIGWNLC